MPQDRVAADQERFERIAGPPEAITGVARSADGSVTVEVGMGGSLRSVQLSRDALRNGGAHLARAVLEAAGAATAKANERAHYAFGHALGPAATNALTSLGIPAPPPSADDSVSDDPLGRRR